METNQLKTSSFWKPGSYTLHEVKRILQQTLHVVRHWRRSSVALWWHSEVSAGGDVCKEVGKKDGSQVAGELPTTIFLRMT